MSKILILLGSLSAEALNRKLALIALNLANFVEPPSNHPNLEDNHDDTYRDCTIKLLTGLEKIPFFNQDLELEGIPDTVNTLREEISDADALLVITPEYNGTMPAVLKNAIDWASRPYGSGALKGKPFGILGSSLGELGGVRALEHVRHSLLVSGATFVNEAFVAIPASAFHGQAPEKSREVVALIDKICADLHRSVPQKIS